MPYRGGATPGEPCVRTLVQKYGGTSVGSVELIQRVAAKVAAVRARGDRIAVVVSAMGDATDRLVDLAAAIAREPSAREMDVLLATGEQVSIALLAMALCEQGIPARSFTGSQVRVRTTNVHRRARITAVETQRLRHALDEGIVPVVAGFQGIDDDGDITTIGRGGSDTSAVALAVALQADECQILTDVDGVYTTDPRLVPDARRLDRISFEEMLELAGQGSRVLHLRSVEFAAKYNVPLRVLSSFRPGPGTLICKEDARVEAPLISGIAFNRDEAQITISGLPDSPDTVARVLKPISGASIEVDMIVLATGREGLKDLSFTVHRDDFLEAQRIAQNMTAEFPGARMSADDKVAKLAVVGVGMRSHAGVATQLFESLARQGVKALLISTSEIKISVLVPEERLESCVKSLHQDLRLG
jgi:aspartate kinase